VTGLFCSPPRAIDLTWRICLAFLALFFFRPCEQPSPHALKQLLVRAEL
jgi:hypothetical protein